MTDLETAKTLRDAAQYIRDHGWRQGELGGPGTPVCALGGCLGALGALEPPTGLESSLDHALKVGRFVAIKQTLESALEPLGYSRFEGSDHPAAVYNDEVGRTAAEVIDLLESVALQHELRAGIARHEPAPAPGKPGPSHDQSRVAEVVHA